MPPPSGALVLHEKRHFCRSPSEASCPYPALLGVVSVRFQTLTLFSEIASGLSSLLPSSATRLNAQARTLQATSTHYYKANQTSSDVRYAASSPLFAYSRVHGVPFHVLILIVAIAY